jgi:hypothetical protein
MTSFLTRGMQSILGKKPNGLFVGGNSDNITDIYKNCTNITTQKIGFDVDHIPIDEKNDNGKITKGSNYNKDSNYNARKYFAYIAKTYPTNKYTKIFMEVQNNYDAPHLNFSDANNVYFEQRMSTAVETVFMWGMNDADIAKINAWIESSKGVSERFIAFDWDRTLSLSNTIKLYKLYVLPLIPQPYYSNDNSSSTNVTMSNVPSASNSPQSDSSNDINKYNESIAYGFDFDEKGLNIDSKKEPYMFENYTRRFIREISLYFLRIIGPNQKIPDFKSINSLRTSFHEAKAKEKAFIPYEPHDVMQYLFGGDERLKKIQNLMQNLMNNNIKVYILTNNAIANKGHIDFGFFLKMVQILHSGFNDDSIIYTNIYKQKRSNVPIITASSALKPIGKCGKSGGNSKKSKRKTMRKIARKTKTNKRRK